MIARIFLWTLLLTGLLGLTGGALAMVGLARWGAPGWYYHYSAEYRLRCGQQALRRGQTEKANEIRLVLEADGHKDHAALLRGEEWFLEAQPYAEAEKLDVAGPLFSKAINELAKIRDQGALRLEGALITGKCFLYMHRYHDAKSALQFVVNVDPNNVDAHRGLASVYYDIGALSRAIMHAEKWAELAPRDGRPYRLIALVYKYMDQFDEAIKNYEEALKRDLPARVPQQDPARVRWELAECCLRRAQYQRALQLLEEFSPLPDDASLVEALRAECLIDLGRLAEGRDVLDKALKLYSNDGDLHRLRAGLHIEVKEFEQAETLLGRALLIDHSDYRARLLLLQVLRALHRDEEVTKEQKVLDETMKDIEERSRLEHEAINDAWDASKRLRLADLCEKLGRPDLAINWRRAAAACPPAPPSEPDRKEKRKSEGGLRLP